MKQSIQAKFVLLLVSTALVPFVLFYAFNFLSYRKVSSDVRDELSRILNQSATTAVTSTISDFERRRDVVEKSTIDMASIRSHSQEIIQTFRVPGVWGQASVIIFAEIESDTEKPSLKIAAQNNQMDNLIHKTVLTEEDIPELASILKENADPHVTERAWVRKTVFQGREALLGHGSLDRKPFTLWVILPYENVTKRILTTEKIIFQDAVDKTKWLMGSVTVFVILAIAAGVYRSRKITGPIIRLTSAGRKLAEGDYDIQVDIQTHDEIQQLGNVFNQIGPGLKERAKIKRSLELASQIQQNFLPKANPKVDNFQVAGKCRYCDETGGDYYDFIEFEPPLSGKVGLVIGDISGHGVGAAMLMASAGSILRNNAPQHGEDINTALGELNHHLVNNSEDSKFMTLFYGLLDGPARKLVWTCAGHDPGLWYQAHADTFEQLENTGMPLGILEQADYSLAGPVQLQKDDIILIGTDGIWEAQQGDGSMYGKQRLRDLIQKHRADSAEQICQAVIESAMEFCGDGPVNDDITLIVVKCVGK
ncbi:MAG: SpoIIE family protein phosphatase [Planctomycetota bacterium]